MKRSTHYLAFALFSLLASPLLLSWGVFGHEHINHAAVLCLPDPLRPFFYNHIDFITQESTVPDLRKYTMSDRLEYPRHFTDLENFGLPDSVPITLAEAQARYDEAFLAKNGTLLWHIDAMMEKLTKAFRERRKTEIIFLAADLGHYIGDAHMPLHTSRNHDGQETGQRGIHAFWEAQLPDLFGVGYRYHCGEVAYISDVTARTRSMLFDSHRLVDTLLLVEQGLKNGMAVGDLYETDASGAILKNKFNQPVHRKDYAARYHAALNGMVEKQLVKAITATACYWYTAWVNAGRPDVRGLDDEQLTKRNQPLLKKELKLLRQGKLIVIESEKEF